MNHLLINYDKNLKTTIMSLSNVEDEVLYFTKYMDTRNEIDAFIEKKKSIYLSELNEKENIANELKKDLAKKEEINKHLTVKIKELCQKEAQTADLIIAIKQEIMNKFLKICQKRKQISTLFDNRIKDYKNRDKELDILLREVNLYINVLKLRIINTDELEKGSERLKAYFVNMNKTLKYIEIDLKEEESLRINKFVDDFLQIFKDVEQSII